MPGDGVVLSGPAAVGIVASMSGVVKVRAMVTPKPTAKPARAIKNDFVSSRARRLLARRLRAGRMDVSGLSCFDLSRASGQFPLGS